MMKVPQQGSSEHAAGPASLRIASRSCTPASNVCCFQVDVLQGINFIAFATQDGCITIQHAVAPPAPASAAPAMSLVQPLPLDLCIPAHGQFVTCCILDDQSSTTKAKPVFEWVSWGGGPGYLLCAASQHHLHFFCLRNFFTKDAAAFTQAVQQATNASAEHYSHLLHHHEPHTPNHTSAAMFADPAAPYPANLPHLRPKVPIPACHWPLCATHRLDHPLHALDWTQSGHGLLLSDTANNVTMLSIQLLGTDSIHVMQGGMPEVNISIAWTACSDSAQPLAAAGWDAGTPSATAHSRPGAANTAQQHRVLIWWPRPHSKAKQSSLPVPPSSPSANAAGLRGRDSAPQSTQGPMYAVGNEVIRHPVKVISMQWSPPLWQPSMSRNSSYAALPRIAQQDSTSKASTTAHAKSLPLPGPNQPSLDPVPTEEPPAEQLALMTVGTDGAVRIWVEVQMKNLLPAHLTAASDPVAAAAAAAALSMSQFCLALVIDPPAASPATDQLPYLRATWAMPPVVLLKQDSGAEQPNAEGKPQPTGRKSLSTAPVLPFGMSHAAVSIASRVQWVVATVGSYHSRGAHGAGEYEEGVYVWAVDGLYVDAGILQQQQQRGAPGSNAGGPRAVMWGKEVKHVSWLTPHLVAQAKDLRLSSRAYVLYPRGMPVFHVVQWWQDAAHKQQPSEARALVVAATTHDAGHTSCPHTGVVLESVSRQLLPGDRGEVRDMQPHPLLHNIAALLHKDGDVSFWWLDPVEELPLVSHGPPSPRHSKLLHAAQLSRLMDPCALLGMFGPVKAFTWLHLDIQHPHQAAGQAGRGGSFSGSSGLVTTHIACAVADIVYVYALHLPDLARLQACSSPANEWGVQVVSEVLRLQLPRSYHQVTRFLHAPGNQLLALVVNTNASGGGGAEQGMGLEADMQPTTYMGAHAILAWSLSRPSHGHGVLASEPTVLTVSDLARADSASSNSSETGLFTCVHVPTNATNTCITGTSTGAVHIWQLDVAHPGSPAAVHTCWCDVSSDDLSRLSSTNLRATSGNTSATAAGPVDSAVARCLPVCVALHETLDMAAAGACCGPVDAEDVLFIWKSTLIHNLSSNNGNATQLAKDPASARAAATCVLDTQWLAEEVIVLRETVACMAWLPSTHGIVAMLALGYSSGLVEYLAACRSGGWQLVARYQGGDEVIGINALAARLDGSLILTTGSQLLVLSNLLVKTHTSGDAGSKKGSRGQQGALPPSLNTPFNQPTGSQPSQLVANVGAVLAEVCGPLPPYHPEALHAMVRCGKAGLACRILKLLISWIQSAAARIEQFDDVGSYGIAEGGEGQQEAGSRLAPEPVLQPPSLSLHQLMNPSDWSSGTVQVLQQLLNAPALSASQPSHKHVPGVSSTETAGNGASAGQLPQQVDAPIKPVTAGNGALAAVGKSALDTGMLDMSAFGAFMGMGDPEAEAQHDAVGEQQLDVSAPPVASQAAPDASSMATGLLDLSAFGSMLPEFDALPPQTADPFPSPAAQPAAVSAPAPTAPAAPAAALQTGMLDMSAFAGFGGDFYQPHEPDPPPPAAAAAEPTEPALAQPPPDPYASLSTGMLDMAAFGMALDMPSSPAPAPPTPTLTPSRAAHEVDDSCMPLASIRAAAKASAAAAGAGGAGVAAAGDAASNSTSQLRSSTQVPTEAANGAAQSASSPASSPATGNQDLVLFPRVLPRSGPAPGPDGQQAQKSPADVGGDWDSLPACLLTTQEVLNLQALLNIDLEHIAASRRARQSAAGSQDPASSGAQQAAALPSYLQEEDGTAALQARAVQLLSALEISQDQALELVLVARALTHTTGSQLMTAASVAGGLGAALGAHTLAATPQPLGSLSSRAQLPSTLPTVFSGVFARSDSESSVGGAAGSTDVMEGLDAPGRAFLLAARLAASHAVVEEDLADAQAHLTDDKDTSSDMAGFAALLKASGGSTVASGSMMGMAQQQAAASPYPSYKQLPRKSTTNVTDKASPGSSGPLSGSIQGSAGALRRSPAAPHRPRSLLSIPSTSFIKAPSPASSFSASVAAADGDGGAGSVQGVQGSTWWKRLGLLPGLDMCSVLYAAASGTQGALLTAALPHVAWEPSLEVLAAPDKGFSAAASVRGVRPDLSWPLMRKLGAGLWLLDQPTLTAKVEELARAQYSRHKEPYECALLYLALGKKAVLLNLFRQSSNRKLVDFLSKDFNGQEAKLAAAKNAYALLGQHKYDLAAAFFLLAGSVKEAVGVLAHERGDPQLALLVARVAEGKAGGPIGNKIIEQDLMPLAVACSDPGAVPCLLWAQGLCDQAVQHLATAHGPVPGLTSQPASSPASSAAHVDPAVLDFLLTVGVKQLLGRPVPRQLSLCMSALALKAAHALDLSGSTFMAIQALILSLALLHPFGPALPAPDMNAGPPAGQLATLLPEDSLKRIYTRFLAASLLHSSWAAYLGSQLSKVVPPHLGHAVVVSDVADSSWRQHVTQQCQELLSLQQQHLPEGCVHPQATLPSLFALIQQYIDCHQSCGQYSLPTPLSLRYGLPVRFPVLTAETPTGASASTGHMHDMSRLQANLLGQPSPSHLQSQGSGSSYKTAAPPQVAPPPNYLPPIATAPSCTSVATTSRGTTPVSRATSGVSLAGTLHSTHSQPGLRPASSSGVYSTGPGHELTIKDGLFGEAVEVVTVEGDRCLAVACCSAAGAAALGRSKSNIRPIVAAFHKTGLVSGEVDLPSSCQAPGGASGGPGDAQGRSVSSWARQGSLFMGLLGQVLEHVRWTPDPWAAVTNTMSATAPPDMLAPRQVHASLQHMPHSADLAQPHSPRQLTASTSSTHTTTLAAHPLRELYLSGSSGDHVFLWHYNDPASHLAYVPLLEPHMGGSGVAPGVGRNAGGPSAFATDPLGSNSVAVALATSAPGRKQLLLQLLASPHWDGAARIRYARAGTRFVGVGAGGLVAVWRQDLAPGTAGLGYADWLHHCVSKKGVDVLPTDEAGHQFIVCGKGDKGGVVSWWDTQAPPSAQCVMDVKLKKGLPTCMQLLSGVGPGTLLVVADDAGDLTAHDLRQLGAKLPVWTLNHVFPSGAPCISLSSWGPDQDPHGLVLPKPTAHPASPAPHAQASPVASAGAAGAGQTVKLRNLMACGGKDGNVLFVDCAGTGSVVQMIDRVHWQIKRNPLTSLLTGDKGSSGHHGYGQGGRPPANAVGMSVNGLVCCEGGLLSTGSDGFVKYHPLNAFLDQA